MWCGCVYVCVNVWGICVSEYVRANGVHVYVYIRMYVYMACRCHDTKWGVPENSVLESVLYYHVRGRDRTLILKHGSK